MSDIDFVFTHRAYSKMMLHILKHIKNDCYGVLIGKVSKQKANNNSEPTETVEVYDTYAFSHDKVFIPQLELFLKMVFNKLQDTQYQILGFYENIMFNFDKSEVKPSPASIFMCEGLSNSIKTHSPFLLEIAHKLDVNSKDNKRSLGSAEYLGYRFSGNNFDQCFSFMESEDLYSVMKKLVSKHIQNDIVDFDDHLLDTRVDFCNSELDKVIDELKK